jgi:hypothetical protein
LMGHFPEAPREVEHREPKPHTWGLSLVLFLAVVGLVLLVLGTWMVGSRNDESAYLRARGVVVEARVTKRFTKREYTPSCSEDRRGSGKRRYRNCHYAEFAFQSRRGVVTFTKRSSSSDSLPVVGSTRVLTYAPDDPDVRVMCNAKTDSDCAAPVSSWRRWICAVPCWLFAAWVLLSSIRGWFAKRREDARRLALASTGRYATGTVQGVRHDEKSHRRFVELDIAPAVGSGAAPQRVTKEFSESQGYFAEGNTGRRVALLVDPSRPENLELAQHLFEREFDLR